MSFSRRDGRNAVDFRDVFISFDGLTRADGSARFGFGETRVVASVSGPIEARGTSQASAATFEVIVRPLAGVPGTESKSLSTSIRTVLSPSLILTQNPRTLIQLVVQSLSPSPSQSTSLRSRLRSNPSLTATHINASSLALLNTASFPMQGVVCAVGVGRLRSSKEIIADPSDDELDFLDGGGVFAFMVTSNPDSEKNIGKEVKSKLVWSDIIAAPEPFHEQELLAAQKIAEGATERIWHIMKQAVADSNAIATAGQSSRPRQISEGKIYTGNTTIKSGLPRKDEAVGDDRMEI